MPSAVAITDVSFRREVLESRDLTIIDLWAEWCEPCRRLAPVLDEIGMQYAGQIKITKLDVEQYPAIPNQYGVSSIPTLLVFKGGQLVETIVGFIPRDRLLNKLLPHLQ